MKDHPHKTTPETSPAEKRLELLKLYTFRLPHRAKRNIYGKKKKSPDDVFPDNFKYRSNCKRRSYKLSKYFDEYLEKVIPPNPAEQRGKPFTTVDDSSQEHVKKIMDTAETKALVSDMKKSVDLIGMRAKSTSKQLLQRRRGGQSSNLWVLPSKDILVAKGKIHQRKREELYKTTFGSTMLVKEDFDPLKIYNWGEKGSGLHSMGPVQDFRTLRDKHYNAKTLFEDPYFPADESSVCYSKWRHEVVSWMRPTEICVNPKLFVDGVSRFDIHQGSLGNCWMLAALSSLTMNRQLFFQVVPLDQAFDEKYAGVFHFRLWNDGKWIDVVIDDRLPVNSENKLCFVQISSNHEFWAALLEKAYAKMQGTYEHIEAGQSIEAFVEFTGGLVEITRFNEEAASFNKMKEAWDRDALICISSKVLGNKKQDETIPEGLVLGHSYTVTNVVDATFRTNGGPIVKEKLMRIRNPWGNFEWNGPWSERSHEWFDVPEKVKKELGLKICDDGEFWMAFSDVVKFFSSAHICHVNPTFQSHGGKYILSMVEGEWVMGVSAGGGRDDYSYNMNPQYLLKIFEHSNKKETTNVVISLLCKNRRRLKHINHTYLSMNISTFAIRKGYPRPLPAVFFKAMHSLDEVIVYEPAREVISKYDFSPGLYVVIPSTWNKAEGEFLLRFYSEEKIKVCPYDEEIGIDEETYVEGYSVEHDQNAELADEIDNLPIEMLFIDKDVIGIHDRQEIFDKFLELSGKEEVINWLGLQSLLGYALENIIPEEELGKDLCRSLIALHDVNYTGALNLVSFFILWSEIIFWVQDFNRHKDSNNEMCIYTLRDAVYGAGFTSNMHLLNLIMHRHGNKRGTLNLHDFLMAIIKFKHMIEAFKKKVSPGTKKARFNKAEFFALTMYS